MGESLTLTVNVDAYPGLQSYNWSYLGPFFEDQHNLDFITQKTTTYRYCLSVHEQYV